MDRIRVLAMLEARFLSGSAKAVLEFAMQTSLADRKLPKIDLSILTFNRGEGETKLTEMIRKNGIPLQIVSERGRFDRSIIRQLQETVANTRIDVIWSNSVKSHFLVRLSGLNKSRKWVAFHHGYTKTDFKMRIYNQLDAWSLRKADRVLTSSGSFVRELIRKNVAASRIHVQHMPIRPFVPPSENEKATLRQKLKLTGASRVLLSVGRLSREKGHSDLVRAFSQVVELAGRMPLRLVVVGEGPERSKIEGLCRELNLAGLVTLTGQQTDVNPYYAIADMFLLPSHSEGCPNVLLEAMAAGVPVVSTSVGGIPEVVTDERDAILVKTKDTKEMALAAFRMLNDAELRSNLIQNAKQVVLNKTPEAYFRSVAAVFRQVCVHDP